MSESLAVLIGVGLDTARYGHHVSFLGADRQPAAKAFTFSESRAGYQQLEAALRQLSNKYGGNVHFHLRIDAAGQYAVNLEAFVRQLPFATTVSVGQPKVNKDYKNVHYPKQKSDTAESKACARYAIVERPAASAPIPPAFARLRDLAGAVSSARRQVTRQINQLHNHLARVFPELALQARDLAAEWVLHLLAKYPTAQRIASAHPSSLAAIPYLGSRRAAALQAAARQSIGIFQDGQAEKLIRALVAILRDAQRSEQRLFRQLEAAYDALPSGPHRQLLTIPGIGKRTAAALVAKIISIDRFGTAAALVSYFGVFPEENTSGVDRRGRPVPKGTQQMSCKGNDLVRGLLWMAAQSAVSHNPAVRAIHKRQRPAKAGGVVLGRCMAKLLHLVFAVWKTDRPFDPRHHVWDPADPALLQSNECTTADAAEVPTPQTDEVDRATEASDTETGTRPASPASITALAAAPAGSPTCYSCPATATPTAAPLAITEITAATMAAGVEAVPAELPASYRYPTKVTPVVRNTAPVAASEVPAKITMTPVAQAAPASAVPARSATALAIPAPAAQRTEAAGRTGSRPKRKAVTAAPRSLATRNVPARSAAAKPCAAKPPTTIAPNAKLRSAERWGSAPQSPPPPLAPKQVRIDFAYVRQQVRMADVLRALGIFNRLSGTGPQRRGPCPIHEPQRAGGRSFSVHLDKQVFRCLDPQCAAHGNVLDLWAAVHRLPLRAAAWNLVTTLHLAPSQPSSPTAPHPEAHP